jgi:hypothetical protein
VPRKELAGKACEAVITAHQPFAGPGIKAVFPPEDNHVIKKVLNAAARGYIFI